MTYHADLKYVENLELVLSGSNFYKIYESVKKLIKESEYNPIIHSGYRALCDSPFRDYLATGEAWSIIVKDDATISGKTCVMKVIKGRSSTSKTYEIYFADRKGNTDEC